MKGIEESLSVSALTSASESTSSYSTTEIEPEKTVADAQLALMRLDAITAGYKRYSQSIVPTIVLMTLSCVAPIVVFVYFAYSEFTTRIYALLGFSVATMLGIVSGYAFFQRGERLRLLSEAERMKEEIGMRLHDLERYERQVSERAKSSA